MIPRLKLPITFDGAKLITTEQDSVTEVAQAVFVSLSTEEGSRVELVDYGLPSQLFAQGGVDTDEIRATLQRDEPRAAEVLTETEWEALLSQRVRITVGV